MDDNCMPNEDKEIKKILLSLSPEVYKKLEIIKKQKNKPSVSEVIRDALSFYDYIYEETNNKDNSIFLGNPAQKKLREVVII